MAKNSDKYNDNVLYRLPLFSNWSEEKKGTYFHSHEEDFRKNPSIPPRKGVPPGQEYPFSYAKYETAVHSVLYGTQFKGYKLTDILGYMDYAPTPGLFRTWRTENRFKSLVENLKEEFAEYMAKNIFFGKSEPSLPEHYPEEKYKGFARKICFIREGLLYSPDLLGRISFTLAECLYSPDKTVTHIIKNREHPHPEISHYLGYYAWCVNLLYALKHLTEKTPKRKIYLEICQKIIGQHWKDDFLINYFERNTPQKKWFFNLYLEKLKDKIAEEKSSNMAIQERYFEEFTAILNTEIRKLAKSENAILLDDITLGIDFLAGNIRFYKYGW